jgi:hypothetical protein
MQVTREIRRAGQRRDVVKVSGVGAGQRAAWSAAAETAGLALACWLREAADAAMVAGATAADLRADLMALRTELGRGVGNNLNQIARSLNIDLRARRPADGAAHAAALLTAARELTAIRRKAEALLRRVERAGQRGRR